MHCKNEHFINEIQVRYSPEYPFHIGYNFFKVFFDMQTFCSQCVSTEVLHRRQKASLWSKGVGSKSVIMEETVNLKLIKTENVLVLILSVMPFIYTEKVP